MVAHAAHQREALLEPTLAPIVEEEAADAAWFVAVAQVEVGVARVLQARMHVDPERLARLARSAMPVPRVLVVAVVRRQVEAAAEPPHRLVPLARREEHAHVHVARGGARVARMRDERDGDGFEAAPRELGPPRRRGRGQRLAHRVREVHGRPLEHLSPFQHARPRQATALALEPPLDEPRRPVLGLEPGGEPVLQPEQPLPDRSHPRHVHAILRTHARMMQETRAFRALRGPMRPSQRRLRADRCELDRFVAVPRPTPRRPRAPWFRARTPPKGEDWGLSGGHSALDELERALL